MATGKALNGNLYAENPHVRFDDEEVASAATPRRGSLLYGGKLRAPNNERDFLESFDTLEIRRKRRFLGFKRQETPLGKYFIIDHRRYLYKKKNCLRKEQWGDAYPDKTFLVIRRGGKFEGLFSYFYTNLGWCGYASACGLIPVIDMQTLRNLYHKEGEPGNVNTWEFFFEQPCGFSLHDIKRAKNVVIADFIGVLPMLCEDEDVETDARLTYWRDIAHRFLRPKLDSIQKYRNKELESHLDSGVIGVLARGTDYTSLRPKGHPRQPTVLEMMDAVESTFYEKKQARIFLVTEDAGIKEQFTQRFGNKLICANQETIAYTGGFLGSGNDVSGNRERGLRYLRAIYDLSRCNILIAGRTSGTIGAVMLSGGGCTRVFNCGVY